MQNIQIGAGLGSHVGMHHRCPRASAHPHLPSRVFSKARTREGRVPCPPAVSLGGPLTGPRPWASLLVSSTRRHRLATVEVDIKTPPLRRVGHEILKPATFSRSSTPASSGRPIYPASESEGGAAVEQDSQSATQTTTQSRRLATGPRLLSTRSLRRLRQGLPPGQPPQPRLARLGTVHPLNGSCGSGLDDDLQYRATEYPSRLPGR